MSTLNKERENISAMFNNIAENYDRLNRILSFGIDRKWRKRVIKHIKSKDAKYVLDLACGTGDLSIEMYKEGISVVGVDIAQKMLDIANIKCNSAIISNKATAITNDKPKFILGSAEEIPFNPLTFDAVTIAFGIRNFQDRNIALKEIHRVLKRGGCISILEFAVPRNIIWKRLYLFYFNTILPLIGSVISKDKEAYKYLPESVKDFPQYDYFIDELNRAGFVNLRYRTLTGGVAVLYTAQKKI